MKKQFQSKSVPRGTRTIWRYLGALFILFTFAVGNVMAELTAHTPGVYEKTTDKGGYGCTLTTVASGTNAGTFEVYYFSAQSKYSENTTVYNGGTKQQYRLMCTDSDSEYQLINTNGTSAFTASCDWIEMAYTTTGFSKSDYTFGTNKFNEFFEITPNGGNTGITKTCYIKPKEGDVMTLKVSGYVEFAILGNDNGSSKYMTITVDGGTPTSWKSNTLSRRAVSLTTGEHTIVVACVGNSANAFYGFSLKVPSCDDANASIIANTSVYVNDELDLEFSSDNTNSVVYDIKKGGSATSDASVTAGVFKATVAGTYVVTATQAKDASNHCAVEESVTITVNAKTPVASVSISGDATAFIGMAKTLTASADQAVSEYKWEVDGVDQGVNAATFDFSAPAVGTYSVVCKARNSFNDPGEYIASSAHSITVTKLCGTLVSFTVSGGTSAADLSGILSASATPEVSLTTGSSSKLTVDEVEYTGYKMDKGKYVGVTLTSGSFKAGDVVSFMITTASNMGGGSALYLYDTKTGSNQIATLASSSTGWTDFVLTSATTGVYLYRSNPDNEYPQNPFVAAVKVTRSCETSTDCEIKSLTINGEAITPSAKVYSYEVPALSALTEVAVAYTIHPLATGTPASGFTVAVPTAGAPAKTQTITVTAEDGTTSDTYTVSVSKAAAASDVVTLDALAVTGYTLDPTFDAATLAYTITKAYGAEDPASDKVTYTKSEEAQTVDVVYDGTNHKFVVTVTAEDNTTTQDYEITINEAEAPKSLSRVLFSNGFDAFIDNTNHTVKAYYLAGTSVPTATTITAGAGTAGELAEGKITVTGDDASTVDYIVTLAEVTPNTTTVADADPAGEFAGDEAWVKNGLLVYGNAAGYSAGDKWYVNRRLTKSGDAADDQRVIAGWVRSYFFVGNASKFIMTVGGNKKLKYSVDGGEAVAVEPTTLEITLTAGNHMIEIVSNQSSGDCRLSAPKLVEMPTLYDVTYSAGEGSVKDGETLPTQAATMEGGKFNLASSDALEKSGYDFTGWLCSADALTYNAGDEYTMTAAATTFTAQWVLHVDPVDPTLTYDEGAYLVGGAALDLSSLITAQTSTGAITYSVKTDGGTGAAIDGNNFTATAAGTAVITASQAAVVGYNAITVDFNVVVTEATEIDGIKLVEAGALTGNFRVKADQLKSGAYTVEGINYSKYVQMGSTHTSFSGETEGNQSKGIYYAPMKKNITFWFYMQNTESSTTRKIYVYTIEEGKAITSKTLDVEAGSHLVSTDITLTTNAEIVFGVENTKLLFCQIVAVESGEDLLQGGQNGYVFDYSKKRQNVAANTLRTIDGIDYKLSAESKINSASNVQLQTLGTHYIKFHLDAPMTVNVYADNKKYYVGTECSTDEAAMLYEATGNGEFTLAAGDWYINGSGAQVKINKLEFALPKCEQPTIAPLADVELCAGDPYTELTVSATKSDEGTLHYAWFKEAGETDEAVGTDAATYTPSADGQYYVVVTNQLADHQDNVATSNTISVEHFASAQITEAPENVYKHTGLNATLSVVAEGKNVSYEWFACDDAEGNNPVAFAPAQTGTSLLLENIEAGVKYYKVLVSSDCGTASAVAKVEGFDDLPLQDVTGNMKWDFSKANDGTAATSSMCNEAVLVNVSGIVNNSDFESDNIMATANKFSSNKLQASMIKFHTTVPGAVIVKFANTGSKSDYRYLVVNGVQTEAKSKDATMVTYAEYVPAGDVVLTVTTANEGNMFNFTSVEFKVDNDLEPYRDDEWLAPGELGTICIPQGAVAVGADIYELVGKEPQYGKIVFETVEHMKPGKPYLFQAKGNRIDFILTDEAEASEPDNSGAMKGTFSTITLTDLTNVYYFADHALWSCVDLTSLSVPANRAYVQMDEVDPISSPSAAPGRRRITMNVHGEQVVTGVENLNASEQPVKLLINGQIFILRGEKLFDATGRLVK